MTGHIVLGYSHELRQLVRGGGSVEQHLVQACTNGGVSCHGDEPPAGPYMAPKRATYSNVIA